MKHDLIRVLASLLGKVHIFWEGYTILRNIHRRYVLFSASQIYGGDFAKFFGLFRIYELYPVHRQECSWEKLSRYESNNHFEFWCIMMAPSYFHVMGTKIQSLFAILLKKWTLNVWSNWTYNLVPPFQFNGKN